MPDGGILSGPALFAGISSLLSTTIIGSVTVGSVLFTVALSGASYALNKAAQKKLQGGLSPEADKQVIKQALPGARVIYGRALVGGALFFAERKGDWLYYGIVLANHEIDGIDEIRMGERRVTFDSGGAATSIPYLSSNSTVYLYKSIRTGSSTQAIDPILAADFPELSSSWRQRGRATVVLKMYFPLTISSDLRTTLYGNGGQPAPLFMVRGKKIFDPRDPSQNYGTPSTFKWSRSPSLCAADFTTTPRSKGGGGADWAEIDIGALSQAANDDDSPVSRKSGPPEPRYTCDGVINLDGTPASEQVSRILTANVGHRITSNGKYIFTSGIRRDTAWTVNDDSARGGMNVKLDVPFDQRLNIVKTAFVSVDREYQTSEGPELRNAAYIAADGAEMPVTVDLPFTTSHTMAQRLANIMLEESRTARRVSRRENIHALLLDASDVVNLESNVIQIAAGQYSIARIERTENPLEFDCEFMGYSSSKYDWNPATQEQDFIIQPTQLAA